jgi:hypothetical protein
LRHWPTVSVRTSIGDSIVSHATASSAARPQYPSRHAR